MYDFIFNQNCDKTSEHNYLHAVHHRTHRYKDKNNAELLKKV